jgi:hypothetical protein
MRALSSVDRAFISMSALPNAEFDLPLEIVNDPGSVASPDPNTIFALELYELSAVMAARLSAFPREPPASRCKEPARCSPFADVIEIFPLALPPAKIAISPPMSFAEAAAMVILEPCGCKDGRDSMETVASCCTDAEACIWMLAVWLAVLPDKVAIVILPGLSNSLCASIRTLPALWDLWEPACREI